MPIHIEGMGVVGSMVAWALYNKGVKDFTWHDTDSPINAWGASTGGIMPSGLPRDFAAYHRWLQWHQDPPWRDGEPQMGGPVVEYGAYWYSSKVVPHAGTWLPQAQVGNLKLHALPTLHMDVQRFVKGTRSFFHAQRMGDPPDPVVIDDVEYIIAHGFPPSPRHGYYLWGWHALARIEFSEALNMLSQPNRPCLYVHRNRVEMGYAYPLPGQPGLHMIGSSILVQKTAQTFDVPSKIATWLRLVRADAAVGVRDVEVIPGTERQGWRPVPPKVKNLGKDTGAWQRDFAEQPLWIRVPYTHMGTGHTYNNTLAVRPMGHSGVRMAPIVMKELWAEFTGEVEEL